MPPEERGRHMSERSKDTPSAHSSGEPVTTKLLRIAERARSKPKAQFTSLFHLMTEELLRDSFKRLSASKAAGIDEVTKAAYAENLEANLTDLVGRLHRMAYRPQPVRRVYIPKPGSDKLRPLGIPCLEDKLVQAGLVAILEAIYEQDFVDDSYGFRPGRSCHDALRALTQTVEGLPINYIVEADIKSFFDAVDRNWMVRFLGHRIADQRILRMVKRFLKAGVLEDGVVDVSETGTVQGGVISPCLANLYLHYTLDLWFARVFRKSCTGAARLLRFADDYVACFEKKEDAERFQAAMIERLGKFGLEVEPTKTKMLEFGRGAQARAKARGEMPATFDFLGFTHYCGTARDGKRFRMKRVTAGKKFRAKLAAYKQWLKSVRTKPTQWIWEQTRAKLRGHYAYYGVTDNYQAIGRFAYEVRKLLKKWLNRRGMRRCLNWAKFNQMLKRFPLPTPRLMVNMYATR
jgi:RNA-directed DNA polymerase